MIELTKKNTRFEWTEERNKAFETLKTKMCERPVLRQPDYTQRFFLATDASRFGMGAVLTQQGIANGKPRMQPIAYYSATFTPMQRNYDVYEWELLAVIMALRAW